MDPHEVMARALASYQQTRSEIEPLARRIAEERKWTKTDYRDVIRELKKQRIPDDQLLPLYTARLEQIEEIIRRENLVTLPNAQGGDPAGDARRNRPRRPRRTSIRRG